MILEHTRCLHDVIYLSDVGASRVLLPLCAVFLAAVTTPASSAEERARAIGAEEPLPIEQTTHMRQQIAERLANNAATSIQRYTLAEMETLADTLVRLDMIEILQADTIAALQAYACRHMRSGVLATFVARISMKNAMATEPPAILMSGAPGNVEIEIVGAPSLMRCAEALCHPSRDMTFEWLRCVLHALLATKRYIMYILTNFSACCRMHVV